MVLMVLKKLKENTLNLVRLFFIIYLINYIKLYIA